MYLCKYILVYISMQEAESFYVCRISDVYVFTGTNRMNKQNKKKIKKKKSFAWPLPTYVWDINR